MDADTWVRRGERPDWGRADCEWWWLTESNWRAPAADEQGRLCTRGDCDREAVAVMMRSAWSPTKEGYVRRRWFCCAEHSYGRVVEDGRVITLCARLDRPIQVEG